MGIVFYFALGLLNVCLLYWFTHLYKRESGINLLSDNTSDILMCGFAYLVSGPFGTVVIGLLGLWLLWLWFKYYRKK
jgi:hypothetical protein